MAESIEDLLFRVRVDPSQLDQLAPEVAEELLKAARAASNFSVDESVFLRAGEQMGQAVLRGLQQFLSGKGIDVSQLFTGDLAKAVDPGKVRQLQEQITNAGSRANSRVAADPDLARQSAQLQSLIERRDRLASATIPRAPLENVNGQPVLRKGANLARDLGLNPADFVRALGLQPGQNLPQASARQTLSGARDESLTRLNREIEALSSTLQRSVGEARASGDAGAGAFANNLNRLAPAFESAGRAKDAFIANLEKLQRVFDAVSTSAANAAAASAKAPAVGAGGGVAPGTARGAKLSPAERMAAENIRVRPEGEDERNLTAAEIRAARTRTAAGNLERTYGRESGEARVIGRADTEIGADRRVTQGLVQGTEAAARLQARVNALLQENGEADLARNLTRSGRTLEQRQRIRNDNARFQAYEDFARSQETGEPLQRRPIPFANATRTAFNTADVEKSYQSVLDRLTGQKLESLAPPRPTDPRSAAYRNELGGDYDAIRTAMGQEAAVRDRVVANSRAQLGPLEEEVRQAGEVSRITNERIALRQRLARAEAESLAAQRRAGIQNPTSPLSNAAQRFIEQDPLARRNAETFQSRQERLQNRQNQQEALRDYIFDPTVSGTDKVRAALTQRVPGQPQVRNESAQNRFLGGFLGERLDPVEQLGQTLKFATFYGGAYTILSQLEGAFSQATQGALQYEDALKNLEIATNNTNEENRALADTLSKIGTSTGFGSAVGVQTGLANIGLYDVSQAGVQQQTAVAGNATEVALRLARLSNTDPTTVSTQLAGTIRGFGLSDQSQTSVEDALAVISKRSGVSAADLLSATAQVGTAASGAGFDLQDTLAAISQIRSGTGDTPTAVAGYLAQIFSRASDPALEARLSSVGVDTQGTTLKQQLDQLSSLNLPREQVQQIAQSFSRGRAGQALNIYLQQRSGIDALAEDARNAPAGEGKSVFNELTRFNFGEQLKRLGTDFQALINELVKSGLVDFLFLLVEAARGAVTILTNVVSAFNALPDPIQKIIVYATELLLVGRALAALGGARAIATAISGIATRGAAATATAAAARLGLGTAVASGTAAAAAARLGLGGGAALAGTARLTALTAPFLGATNAAGTAALAGTAGGAAGGTGIIAALRALGVRGTGRAALARLGLAGGGAFGLGVAGGVYTAVQNTNQTNYQAEQANRAGAVASTVDQLRAAADQQQAVINRTLETQSFGRFSALSTLGLEPLISKFGFSPAARTQAEARTRKDALDAQATALEESQQRAIDLNPAQAFSDFSSTDAVSNAMETLSTKGLNAKQSLDALNDAFDGLLSRTGQAGTNVAAYLNAGSGDTFATALATAGGTAVNTTVDDLRRQANIADPAGNPNSGYVNRAYTGVGQFFNGLVTGNFRQALEGATGYGGDGSRLRGQAQALLDANTPDVNAAVQDAVRQGYSDLGIDPNNSDVALSQDQLDSLRDRAAEALKSKLGKAFTDLDRGTQDALISAFTSASRQTLGDFTQTQITGANAQAYASTLLTSATASGQRTAGLTRSESAGTSEALNELQGGRARLAQALANAQASGASENDINTIRNQLEAVDTAINQNLDTQIQQRMAAIDASTQLAQSGRGLDDTVGRQQDTLDGIAAKLALPNLTMEQQNALIAQQQEAQKQQAQNQLQASQSLALAAVDPRNAQALLAAQVANAQSDVRFATPGSAAAGQAQQQLNQLMSQQIDYSLNYNQQLDLSRDNPGNQQQALNSAVADAQRRYNQAKADGDPLALATALTALNQANYAVVQYALQVTAAQRAAVQPRNQLKQLNDAIQNAQETLADARTTGDPEAIARAQASLDQARAAVDDYNRESATSARAATRNPLDSRGALVDAISAARDRVKQVTAIAGQYDAKTINDALAALNQAASQLNEYDTSVANTYALARFAPDDRLGRAGESMRQAQATYQKYLAAGLQDTQEAAQAFAAMKQAEYDYAQAVLNVVELTNIALAGDSTDPVRQAQIRYEQLLARQRAASTPEEKAALQPDIDAANSDLRLAPIDKKLRDIGNDHDLKKITDSEYINALQTQLDAVNAQLALMDPLAEGYDALAQKSVEIQKLIQGAAESLNSEFNLNDVQLPTVYEVRRAVGASADAIRSQVVDYSSTQAGGGTVIINGADMAQVIDYISQTLGKGSTSVYTTSPRRTV